MHESIPLNVPCEFINITPVNPLISKCQIKVCYVGQDPNRNRSIITKEVATQMANSLPGSPIVGFFNENTKDFEEHNREIVIEDGQFKLKDVTRPYGFVDLGAKCWFQKFSDDGIEHEYLMTEGYLWTGQYPECQRVIDEGNNQSMELSEKFTNAFWTKTDNGKPQFFIINETIISKLCILGQDYEPCFEGASIGKFQFSFDDSFNQEMYSMMKEVSKYLNKGGELMSDTENMEVTEVVEEATVTESQEEDLDFKKKKDDEDQQEEQSNDSEEDASNEEDAAADEEDEKKKKKAKYSLEEIPEYVELVNKYAALEATNNELNTTIDSLNNQISSLQEQLKPLVDFKNNAEKEKKEELINSFYMLSDVEKQDVISNIDKYSYDEIEAKLSIICVRNKVSFNLDEDNKKEETHTTFNLEDSSADTLTPAWVKAVLDTEKNLKR